MLLEPEDADLLRTWIIKKIENHSDADSDVLADYAMALVSTDDAEDAARQNTVESLKDFLPEDAESFVDELFKAIASRSYDPSRAQVVAVAPKNELPHRSGFEAHSFANESRKRSFQWEKDDAFGQEGRSQGGSRLMKQPRRGGRGGSERGRGYQQGPASQSHLPFSQLPAMPPMPSPAPRMPSFDPNNPMAAFLAMQQAMGMIPGMPNAASPPNGSSYGQTFAPPQRCRDYDTKGFCTAGATCPFEHGTDSFVIPSNQEYDPSNALLSIPPSMTGKLLISNARGRGGRGHGRGVSNYRGGGTRSDFSQLGPAPGTSNTSIVVEQIPLDKLNEVAIREFFTQFGNIGDIKLHVDKKLAIIRYDSNAAAKAAYESPKVVFDNRFVKVYWYKQDRFEQDHGGSNGPMSAANYDDAKMEEDNHIDAAEIIKRQEEAQRKHEEAKKQREEAGKQKQSLDEKLKRMDEERRKMAALLAKKSRKQPSSSPDAEIKLDRANDGESEQTKGLKAQLAKLEAEAVSLGIDPNSPTTNGFGAQPYRGRGGFRGRGRGGGFNPGYRGGWAGGGGRGGRGGAVMRLDNRPKTIAVTFADGNYDAHDEALRQFLLFNSLETASITKHDEKDDTALVTFKQRYEGDNFMAVAKQEIPHAGKVELAWYDPMATGKGSVAANATISDSAGTKMEVEGYGEGYGDGNGEDELDLDRYA